MWSETQPRAFRRGASKEGFGVRRACVLLAVIVMGVSVGTADAGISSPPILNMECQGEGHVTVVLISGYGDPQSVWQVALSPTGQQVASPLEPQLERRARVCTYDRSGEGKTPATNGPQTFSGMAAALHRTLRTDHVTGPLVLVGHSLGGDVAVTYAARYRADVRGVVLLDATPADFARRTVRLIPATATGPAAAFRDQLLSVLDWRTNTEHLDGAKAFPQLGRIRSLARGIRLRVLAHGISFAATVPKYGSALENLWRAGQHQWAALVPHTKVQTVAHSGHYIYLYAPNLVARIVLGEITHAAR